MNQDNADEDFDPKLREPPPPYSPRDSPQLSHSTNTAVETTNEPTVVAPRAINIAPADGTQTAGMYQVHAAPVVLPMLIGNQMGPEPTTMTCESCKEVIVTKIKARPNTKTHMCAFVLCFMCCIPCVFLPYVLDICRNADHYCPNCNAYIGSYVH